MKHIPSFQSEQERQRWFIDNAEYFTAITRRSLRNERREFPNLKQAEAYALAELKQNPAIRSFLIYAVVNASDSFVKSILRDHVDQNQPVTEPKRTHTAVRSNRKQKGHGTG